MKKMNKSEYQDDQKLRAEYQKVLISKAMREIRDEEADSLLESSPEDQRYLEYLETSREKRRENDASFAVDQSEKAVFYSSA